MNFIVFPCKLGWRTRALLACGSALVGSMTAAAPCPHSTFAFSMCDEFSGTSIDKTVWTVMSTAGEGRIGATASVHDGMLDLAMDRTDDGGQVKATVPGLRRIRVSLRHNMHRGGEYFMPAIYLEGADKSAKVGLRWVRSRYQPDYCGGSGYGTSAGYDRVVLHTDISTSGWCNNVQRSSATSSSFFDRWSNAVIDYDLDTGVASADIDGDGSVDLQATVPAARRTNIHYVTLQPFGWWTGHRHQIDSIRIEGTPADSTPASTVPAPTLTRTPAQGELVAGSTLQLTVGAPEAQTSYELCLGAVAGDYSLGCVPMDASASLTVTVAPDWNFVVAARAVRSGTKSAFSAPITIQSESSARAAAWVSPRLGADLDHVRKAGNQAPTLQLVVNTSTVVRPGQIVDIAALSSDPDSLQRFYHWYASAGAMRAGSSGQLNTMQWRAPAQAGRYVIRASVGDADGNSTRAYVLITVQ